MKWGQEVIKLCQRIQLVSVFVTTLFSDALTLKGEFLLLITLSAFKKGLDIGLC